MQSFLHFWQYGIKRSSPVWDIPELRSQKFTILERKQRNLRPRNCNTQQSLPSPWFTSSTQMFLIDVHIPFTEFDHKLTVTSTIPLEKGKMKDPLLYWIQSCYTRSSYCCCLASLLITPSCPPLPGLSWCFISTGFSMQKFIVDRIFSKHVIDEKPGGRKKKKWQKIDKVSIKMEQEVKDRIGSLLKQHRIYFKLTSNLLLST